jgi:uncharacterized protein YrzB (UPF0473 family)
MSLISLYRKYSFVDYQNRVCSFAFFITFFVYITAIVLPFVWILKVNDENLSANLVSFEQPAVKFQYKYILLAEHSMETDGNATLCSSFEYLNKLDGTSKCAKIKVIEKDENFDGIADEINFKVDFHTSFHYGIKSLSLAIFLDARIKNFCNFRVPTAIVIKKKTFSNNMNDRKIVISGNLAVDQKVC